jgi:sucrose-6-phosphate hydrolase SacC (GH32 family)
MLKRTISAAGMLAAICQGAEPSCDAILDAATACWRLSAIPDHVRVDGEVKSGIPAEGMGATAGAVVTRFGGGWLEATGAENARGTAVTVWLRARVPDGNWTKALVAKRGGHDRVNFNLFAVDLGHTPGPDIGFEVRTDRGFFMVSFPVSRIAAKSWHDLAGRFTGRKIQVLCDGVVMAESDASGELVQNKEPLLIGAETDDGGVSRGRIFHGDMEAAAVWHKALSDEELAVVMRQPGLIQAAALGDAATAAAGGSDLEGFRRMRDRLLADPHRPLWHFLCPEQGHAMPFDPNGAIFWKGRRHLFYIFQRAGGVHCWGHASSADMVHWRQHPTGLDVAPGDPDRGIFSGNAFLDKNGVPTIMYHGVGVGNCIAQSRDDMLEHWEKAKFNPIVPIPKPGDPGHGKFQSWDPHGWWEGGSYYAIFGGSPAALMKGPELNKLAYLHAFVENDQLTGPEDDISCPDFFRIGGRHALVAISHRAGVRWWTGEWKNDRFVADKQDRITFPGGSYFAPESFNDGDGRRILWGWVLDPRANAAAAGWSGCMSLPVVVSLDEEGALTFSPSEELQRLRRPAPPIAGLTVEAETETIVREIAGDCLELSVEADVPPQGALSVLVRRSPDGAEQTAIVCDRKTGELRLDCARSSLDKDIHYKSWVISAPRDAAERDRRLTGQAAPFSLRDGEKLRLRIFLDRSIVEVFGNGRRYLTQRIFPQRRDSLGVALRAEGGRAGITRIDAWPLDAANPF